MTIMKNTTSDTSHAHIDFFFTPHTVKHKQTRLTFILCQFLSLYGIEIELCRWPKRQCIKFRRKFRYKQNSSSYIYCATNMNKHCFMLQCV